MYATVTVTGPTYTRPDGELARGFVSIRPTVAKVYDAAGNVVISGTVKVPLVAGTFTIELPATDDPNLSPSGFGYRLTEHLTHAGTGTALSFLLPTTPSTVDLLDVVEIDPSSPEAVAWRDSFRTEMEAVLDDAIQITGISDTDAAVAALVDTPAGPLTQAALSATIESGVVAGLGNPASPIGDAARDYFLVIGSQVTDTAGAASSMLDLQHNADGSGHTSQQTYGLEIHNRPGARAAQVIHQYSSVGPALWIDNTDTNDALYIHNTDNNVLNPGRVGSGNFAKFIDHGVTRFLVRGKGTVLVTTEATATDPGIQISHNHTGMGMSISTGAGGAGYYALNISAQDQGVNVVTAGNFGLTFGITKNGTTGGDVLRVTNKGTGPTALFKTAAASVAQVNPDGEFEHLTAGKGIVLKSPDGTRYRITVANGGTVAVAAA